MLNKKIFRDFSWSQVPKYLGIFLLIFLGILLVAFIAKLAFVYVLYNFFSGMIMSAFGLDLVLARGAAVFLSVISLLLLPTIFSFFVFGNRKKEILIGSAIIFGIFSTSIYYGASDVFFDRQTGQPLKYYIKTLEGFKFSNSDDFDPQLAIKYKQIDAQTAKEYYLWQKTGELQIPQVEKGKYFDRLTGEPIVWYAEREEGKIELFGLPGFDQSTGELLKPITKQILQEHGITNSNLTIHESRHNNIRLEDNILSQEQYEDLGLELTPEYVYYIDSFSFLSGSSVTFNIITDRVIWTDSSLLIGCKARAYSSIDVTINSEGIYLFNTVTGMKWNADRYFFATKKSTDFANTLAPFTTPKLKKSIHYDDDEIRIIIIVFKHQLSQSLFRDNKMCLYFTDEEGRSMCGTVDLPIVLN